MIVTIYEGYTRDYVLLKSQHPEFKREYGKVKSYELYKDMLAIATWCNNEIGEECLFEVEN